MNFSTNVDLRLVKRLLCGASLSAIACAIAGQALAQDNTSGEPESVTVTATGTSIKGIAPVGTNLITVDASTIKATGAITTDEILNQIPQIANTFNTQTVSPTAINIGGVRPSIRYNPAQNIVGGSATLLLLDGHDMVGISGLATAPDAGVIPTIVLRQVDVLPDGASSIYGANAINGVINFVTRDTYQGFEGRASVGVADGYSSFNAAAMAGTDWGDGGAYLAFEHKDNTYLMANKRSYTKMDLTGIGGRDSRGTACDLPNISVAGGLNYALTSSQVSTAPGSLKANVSAPFGALNATTNAGLFNRCDTNSYSSLYPREEQNSFYGQFHQHIMNGVEFSTKFLWSNRLDSALIPELSATGTIDNTNPYFQSINGETSQTIQFAFGPYAGRQSLTNYNDIQVFQVTPKLTVDLPFGDWQAVGIVNYGRSLSNGLQWGPANSALLNEALRQTTIAGVLSPALIAAPGLSGNALDPYNLTAGNPQVVNQIVDNGQIAKAIQHKVEWGISANGTLFELPGGAVKAAIGGQWAFDDYIANWNTNWNIGANFGPPVPGSQVATVRPHRITKSGFGEVNVPLVGPNNELPFVHSLTFNVSGRIDDYSDFGDTENYKLGFTYEPFAALTIRGTRGTSFDAPSLADTTAPDTRFTYTPQRTSANTNVPPGTSAADALRPSISSPGGNPLLGPELGSTWSIGGDFHPTTEFGVNLTGLDVSITAFHVKFEHQIAVLVNNPTALFSGSFNQFYILNPTLAQIQARYQTAGFAATGFPGPDVASAFAPGVNPPYIFYDLRRNNLGTALDEGVDFAVNYTTDIEDFGTLSSGLSATVNTTNESQSSPTAVPLNIVKYNVPLSASTAFVAATVGPVTARATVQYSPGFNLDPVNVVSARLYGQTRVASFHPINLFASYDLGTLAPWLSGSEFSITMNNVGDEDPPIRLEGGTSAPGNGATGIVAAGGTLGRYTVFSVRKQF